VVDTEAAAAAEPAVEAGSEDKKAKPEAVAAE
jgi:hypothetical protein